MGTLLLVAGLVGFAAAFILAVEKFLLLTNPFFTPSCNISARLNCGAVMSSPQAELLGFPNPLLGIGSFAVVAASGAALIAGGRLAQWYWSGLQVGVTGGLLLVLWLMCQSVFVIGALCPYCMVVWLVVFTTFWYVTLRNLAVRRPMAHERGRVLSFVLAQHSAVLSAWILAAAVLVFVLT